MTENQRKAMHKAIAEHISVPAHVEACAGALRYDLMNGPSFSLIPQGDVEKFDADCVYFLYSDAEEDAEEGDKIVETLSREVFDCFRDFIDDLPSRLFYHLDCGCIMEREPEGEEIDTGEIGDDGEPIMEWCEPGNYYELERRDIIEALFGRTLAQEIH